MGQVIDVTVMFDAQIRNIHQNMIADVVGSKTVSVTTYQAGVKYHDDKINRLSFIKELEAEVQYRKENNIKVGYIWPTPLPVVGITFRVKSMDEITSKVVHLEREPDNQYDKHAIKVSIMKIDINAMKVNPVCMHQIGYIPKEVACQVLDKYLPSKGIIIWRSTDERGVGVRIGV